MKLLALADLHGKWQMLVEILRHAGPVDAILLGGDLTQFGTPDQAAEMLRVARRAGKPVWAVAGNCDSAEIDRLLVEQGAGLHGRAVTLEKLGIHGVSAAPPWLPHMYGLSEDQLAEALQAGHQQLPRVEHHLVLAHVPPADCRLDRTATGLHVGSKSLRRFVDRRQPGALVCGHVHEARGTERLGHTLVVNCGPAAAGYYAILDAADGLKVELCKV